MFLVQFVGDKVAFELSQGLKVIACVGETLEQREARTIMEVVAAQTRAIAGTVETYEDHVRICKDGLPPNKKGRRLGLNYLNESTSGMPASTSSDPIMQQKLDTLDRKVEDMSSQQQILANMMQQMMMMMQQNYQPEQPTDGQGDDDGEYDDEY